LAAPHRRAKAGDEPQNFFSSAKGRRFRFELRCDDNLTKNFADRFGQRFIDRPVQMMIHQRRNACRGECFSHRRTQIDIGNPPRRDSCVSESRPPVPQTRRSVSRRADVENVVKRKFLAVEFFENVDRSRRERGGSMRVFPRSADDGKRNESENDGIGGLFLIEKIPDGAS